MKKVFRFTMKDTMHGKGFYTVTFGVAAFLIVLGIGILGMISIFQIPSEETKAKINHVYVINETDCDFFDFSSIKEPQIEMSTKTVKEAAKEINQSQKEDVLVRISVAKNTSSGTTSAEGISLVMMLKNGSELEEDTGYELLEKMSGLVKQSQLVKYQITPESLSVIMAPTEYEYTTVGEEPKDMASTLLQIFAPMVLILILYFMILIYGQSIGKTVTAEKTSKLMETLLLTVKPYDLIAGKVFAMALVGILQFLTWTAGLIIGIVGGHFYGKFINPEFNDPIWGAFSALRAIGIGTAFTVPAVILCVLALCLGFTFYCVLAGLISSRISKAEDLGQGMGTFQVLVIIGFFGAYFPQFQGKISILTFIRWFPLTSAFSLPADILLGNVSLKLGVLMLAVLVAFMLVLIWVTGKMYRNQVFYQR